MIGISAGAEAGGGQPRTSNHSQQLSGEVHLSGNDPLLI